MTTDATYLTIKSVASFYFLNSEVILFGSRVRNENRQNSDYDILVIVPQKISIAEKMFYKSKIRKTLAKKNIPIDILIEDKEEMQAKLLLSGHIVKEIMKEGIRL